jgi:hypothetical protein
MLAFASWIDCNDFNQYEPFNAEPSVIEAQAICVQLTFWCAAVKSIWYVNIHKNLILLQVRIGLSSILTEFYFKFIKIFQFSFKLFFNSINWCFNFVFKFFLLVCNFVSNWNCFTLRAILGACIRIILWRNNTDTKYDFITKFLWWNNIS